MPISLEREQDPCGFLQSRARLAGRTEKDPHQERAAVDDAADWATRVSPGPVEIGPALIADGRDHSGYEGWICTVQTDGESGAPNRVSRASSPFLVSYVNLDRAKPRGRRQQAVAAADQIGDQSS